MNSIIKPVITDYNTNILLLEELMKEFPFLHTEIQGRSALGRGIFSFSIGKSSNSALAVGGFYGTDFLSSLLLMLFTERLCRCVKYGSQMCGTDVKKALSQVGITIIPCINPDGREIAIKGFESAKNLCSYLSDISPEGYENWNANAFGTDISRNFSKGWSQYRRREYENGCAVPSAAGCSGEYAESEAETRVLTRLCRLKSFTRCISLSHGKNKLCHYASEDTPAASTMMGKILADSASCIFTQGYYTDGDATFGRWFSEEFSRPAFSLGFEGGFPDELYRAYERIEEALLLFLLF